MLVFSALKGKHTFWGRGGWIHASVSQRRQISCVRSESELSISQETRSPGSVCSARHVPLGNHSPLNLSFHHCRAKGPDWMTPLGPPTTNILWSITFWSWNSQSTRRVVTLLLRLQGYRKREEGGGQGNRQPLSPRVRPCVVWADQRWVRGWEWGRGGERSTRCYFSGDRTLLN